MRKLTILRKKSFVACLAAMQVYIEDPSANELTINGTPCRKLGTLKNGEQKTFEISNEQARLYVIADKLSKNLFNEFYDIPAGFEDISLSGKNHLNPGGGNPFYFDGVTNADILRNRKKGKLFSVILIAVSVLVGAVLGFMLTSGMRANRPQTFVSDEMQITLTGRFSPVSAEGFYACFESKDTAVLMLREPFSLAEGFGDCTLEEYGDLVLQANGLEGTAELKKQDGLTYFEYQSKNPETNDTYHYFSVIYKSADAFWIVHFSTLTQNAEKCRPDYIEWAKTVTFPEN